MPPGKYFFMVFSSVCITKGLVMQGRSEAVISMGRRSYLRYVHRAARLLIRVIGVLTSEGRVMATFIMVVMVMVVSPGVRIELFIACNGIGTGTRHVHVERMPSKHAHLPQSQTENAKKR
jgi:hypothetical protein